MLAAPLSPIVHVVFIFIFIFIVELLELLELLIANLFVMVKRIFPAELSVENWVTSRHFLSEGCLTSFALRT